VKRLLVTGSRTWTDEGVIYTALRKAFDELGGPEEEIVLVHGAAKGADTIAATIWSRWAMMPLEAHRAMWEVWGKKAGRNRNAVMVQRGADMCLAFIVDGSSGASHCAALAEEAGIPVKYFRVSKLGQETDDGDSTNMRRMRERGEDAVSGD
jgi:N-methylhydantoinase A/oxoprolinase/acetone carboxylase beta subunit